MAGTDTTESDEVQDMEASRVGSHVQRAMYLREPIRLNAEENSDYPIWRVGSVVCEDQL